MEKINAVLWGAPLLTMFLFTGIFFSCVTGFFQIRRAGEIIRHTLLTIIKPVKSGDPQALSPFACACTALGAAIGTGNIVGVSVAISLGGAGAVFWMWVCALFGMMTAYAENALGNHFRYRDKKGQFVGGPMAYIEKGLKNKKLALMYALLATLGSFGMGCMVQSSAIAGAMRSQFSLPDIVTGVVLLILVTLILRKGKHVLAIISQRFVPVTAALYAAGCIGIIILGADRLPGVFTEIFNDAFSFTSVGGGVSGFFISRAVKWGFRRGIFSNEAGLGSAAIASADSSETNPAVQGMWGIFVVFFDTIVSCTLTALAVLCSGVLDSGLYTASEGVTVAIGAFGTVFGSFAGKIVALSIGMFAFSTILGWSYYGQNAFSYITRGRALFVYKTMFIILLVTGVFLQSALVWSVSDTINALLALINLPCLLLLYEKVIELTKKR